MKSRKKPNVALARDANDRFRSTLDAELGGVAVSDSVRRMQQSELDSVFQAVRESTSTADAKHSYGSASAFGIEYSWSVFAMKRVTPRNIDLQVKCVEESEDETNEAKTWRLITIMLPDERRDIPRLHHLIK